MPGGAYRGVSLRAYDAESGQWAIWWLDGRDPSHALDPPMKGRFESAGTFYATIRSTAGRSACATSGRRSRRRARIGSRLFSPDGGKTWETNWMSDFKRAATDRTDPPQRTPT
jgi:hypothetical protein